MTSTAEADLAEIWAYIALEASEAAATRLLGRIEKSFLHLTDFPRAGPAREQLGSGLRVKFQGKYAITISLPTLN